jgi:hypothetical protein
MVQSFSDWATHEMKGTPLPDERFRHNLVQMCSRLSIHCGQSFSGACGPAIRKSANRLFSHEGLELQDGHIQQTVDRCRQKPSVLVLEDTTDLNYASHRQTTGLGDLGGGDSVIYGVCAHSALAVSLDKEPLGLLGQHIWAPINEKRGSSELRNLSIEQKESYKWLRTLKWLNNWMKDYNGQAIVVGDQEGDFYEHFSASRNPNVELVIRLHHRQRLVIWENKKMNINELQSNLCCSGERKVVLSARKGQKERTAILSVYYAPIICPASENRTGSDVPLYVVWAVERDIKPGIEPIEWIILTTIPIENFEDACRILDIYTTRWIIERFHYVLKQGLRVERLQFDNFPRLTNAIKLCSIVAWQLLRIAYLSKAKEFDTADPHFDKQEQLVLEKLTGSKIETVKDHILALGKLVGFVPSKKQPYPGEKLLWQAVQQLNSIKLGFILAQNYGTG